MQIILVDDARARRWSPFAETRPIGELRFGAMLLRERVERFWNGPVSAHLLGDGSAAGGASSSGGLAAFDEPGSPPVLDGERPVEAGTIFWLSRAAPRLSSSPPALPEREAAFFTMEGILVGLWIPEPGSLAGAAAAAAGKMELGSALPGGLEAERVDGHLLDWPWSLVELNAEALSDDARHLYEGDSFSPPGGVHLVGHELVSLGPGARIGPGVVLDTRDGPIRLDDDVVVEGPARLVGPLHLGAGSIVFGGHLSRVSAGPVCKLRGEIDTAVLVGFVNKAHDGYLGHALLGRWVNLGALTTNSDLKNDYGPVRVELPTGTVDTGAMKVGVFLGDHVKTGIGTVLNTGTVVGAGSNVFGGGMPPKSLPPFSWYGGGGATPFRWEKFVEVARTVTSRRNQPWTPGSEETLHRLWEATHGGASRDPGTKVELGEAD